LDQEVIGGLKMIPVLSLMSMLGAPNETQIDVLDTDNAEHYWHRCTSSTWVSISPPKRADQRNCASHDRWISPTGIDVVIEPLTELRDTRPLGTSGQIRGHEDWRSALAR
jgi:hypothetical protein